MGETRPAESDEARPVRRVHLLAPFRAGIRFAGLLAWALVCFVALVCVSLLGLVSEAVSRKARGAVSRVWVRTMSRIMGTRITVHGTPPRPPFFLVINHLAWIDFFVVNVLCDAVCIVEAPVGRIRLIGALVKGLGSIFVHRVKEDTPRVNDLMVRAIEQGQSLLLAPETPETTFPRRERGARHCRGGMWFPAYEREPQSII